MGKFYSVQGKNLYIYVTEGDELIDLRQFPQKLNLFEGEADWRVSPKIAICCVEDEGTLECAEDILRSHGYERTCSHAKTLENYFLLGDESLLNAKPSETDST